MNIRKTISYITKLIRFILVINLVKKMFVKFKKKKKSHILMQLSFHVDKLMALIQMILACIIRKVLKAVRIFWLRRVSVAVRELSFYKRTASCFVFLGLSKYIAFPQPKCLLWPPFQPRCSATNTKILLLDWGGQAGWLVRQAKITVSLTLLYSHTHTHTFSFT